MKKQESDEAEAVDANPPLKNSSFMRLPPDSPSTEDLHRRGGGRLKFIRSTSITLTKAFVTLHKKCSPLGTRNMVFNAYPTVWFPHAARNTEETRTKFPLMGKAACESSTAFWSVKKPSE